ncbi:hypothetical protein GC722_00670 [Auraticoccus sp. F435]|uniref:Bacterial Ig domain-containing protein n=1 Tax=Auraticoccus cholistanensis TaxID=2656650 RepID=A0A6A9USK2_9ACTN|nr:hypothetical protein [Auraticoccus cholistanensis]MVA74554.1 hypothetical protein [Auraticoccus cholistanensis]
MPAPVPRRRSVVACLVAAAAVLLPAAGSGPAAAITTTAGQGRPGEVVAVELVTERDQGRATWVVQAPPGTSFTRAPRTDEGPGASGSSCPLVSATEARCEPRTGWPAGTRLRAELTIAATAPAGTTTGTSSVGDESSGWSLTVLPPPAPTLTAPAVTRDRTPELRGTRDVVPGPERLGHAVTVSDDQGRLVCSVPAAAETSWRCTPDELPVGESVLLARQTSPGGSTSPASTPQVVRVVAPVTVDRPLDGATVSSGDVAVTGTADPGSPVRVRVGEERRTVPTDERGRFATVLTDLRPGRHRITAQQQVAGAATSSDTVTVVVPAPPAVPPAPRPQPTERPDPTPSRPAGDPEAAEPAGPAAAPPTAPGGRQPSAPPVPAGSAPDRTDEDEDGEDEDSRGEDGEHEGRGASGQDQDRGAGRSVTGGRGAAPGGGGPWTPERLVPVSLSAASLELVPGAGSRLTGRVGPNPSDEAVTVTVEGLLGRGVRYRAVTLAEEGGCSVTATRFRCRAELAPQQGATLTVHLLADAASPSPRAVHRLLVSGEGAATGPGAVNAVTSVLDLTSDTPSDTDTLSTQVSDVPGPLVVVLALFLFALAATVAERGR